MASKVDLRLEIEALCKSRSVSLPDGLDRMNFAALTAALAGLQLSEGGAPSEPPAAPPGLTKLDPPAPAAPAAEPTLSAGDVVVGGEFVLSSPPPAADLPPDVTEPPPPPPIASPQAEPVVTKTYRIWQVAQGQSVTTVRGQVDGAAGARVGAFGEVKAKDFLGGQSDIDLLARQGVLVPKS